MKISRREFLKWMAVSGTALGIGKVNLQNMAYAMENLEHTPVIWVQAAGCTGCTVAFLNMVKNESTKVTTVDDMLMNHIDLKYHNTLMAMSGREAVEMLNPPSHNNYILIVEGWIPTANNGIHCIIGERDGHHLTALQVVRELGQNAKHVIAIGQCAAFRGVAKAGNDATGAQTVEGVLGTSARSKIINLPGCPVHPYIIGGTLIKLLLGQPLPKDSDLRPTEYYASKALHSEGCPLKGTGRASGLGVIGNCFSNLNCKGKDNDTRGTCYTALNWGNNWSDRKGCFGTGNICIGCVSKNFPFSRIY